VFSDRECETAVAMMREAITDPGSEDPYQFVVAELRDRIVGYACFGSVPLTQGCFDLYWIVVDPGFQGQDIGRTVLLHCEKVMARQGARLVVVETSARSAYAAARAFYERVMGYTNTARIKDFYKPGDDKLLYVKYLAQVPNA